MRSWMLIFLLFLSVVLHEAQGLRLRKGTPQDRKHNTHIITQRKRSHNHGANEDASWCKGKHCYAGRIRKLVMTAISSTTTIEKNEKNQENKGHSGSKDGKKLAKKDENLSANSYPDILDIAGMDYSQARRKPPIHN